MLTSKRASLIFAFISLLMWSIVVWAQESPASQEARPPQSSPPTIRLGLGPKASTPSEKVANTRGGELEVPGGQQWVDTKIDLAPGDRVNITASGSVQFQMQASNGPEGQSRGWADLIRSLPVNSAGRGALVGRIGSADFASPFLIGPNRDIQVRQAGRLFLGVNQLANDSPTGSFKVKIEIIPAEGAANNLYSADMTTLTPAESSAQFTPEFFQKLPRRVSDAQGNAGDMVNFLILGSEDQVRQLFQSAGWVKVDSTTQDAVMHGLLSSISKQAYVEMPMSELTLFGRPQDYGFAHAEPVSVVSTRHHLRIWKAPFEVGGLPLWVGAGTHDIGFERDQRNNGVTHKIDPAIDGERDFIAESLKSTGMLTKSGYVTPPNPLTDARTATGGSFHSDGRILVMMLASGENK